MKYINLDNLLYDENEEMDIAFGKEYEEMQSIREVTTPEYITEDRRLQKLARLILDEAIAERSTDIQIKEASGDWGIVKFRLGDEMHAYRKIRRSAVFALIIVIKRMARVDINEDMVGQRGRITHVYMNEHYDIRASFMPSIEGTAVSLRVLYSSELMQDVSKLGFPEYVLHSVKNVLNLQEGLILLTGGTGSGKTTTMYTAINDIMHENGGTKNVITIEDPVEYIVDGAVQSQVDEVVGYTFAEGLKVSLRQNPDILLIGEINDQETAETAVRASTSGHLVFSTLHSNDVLGVGQVLEHYNVSQYQLSWALQMVLNQTLARKLCDGCKRQRMITEDELKWTMELGIPEELLYVYTTDGCEECSGFGYRGRVLIVEMLDANAEYTKIANEGLTLTELEERLMENDKVRYYPKKHDVYRHLKEGNIDIVTARNIIR